MTLRTLNYGNYGIFLIMGNAGFCPSTVSHQVFRPVCHWIPKLTSLEANDFSWTPPTAHINGDLYKDMGVS